MKNSDHVKHLINIISINFRNDAGAAKSIEENVKSINWTVLTEDKYTHKLLPLVYFTLKKNNLLEYVPEDVSEKLKGWYYSLLKRNSLLFNELSIVLKDFETNKIEALVLKGAALAEKTYPEIGLRPMSDIDLLVKNKAEFQKAELVFKKSGYDSSDEESNETFSNTVLYEKAFFKNNSTYTDIDLHHLLPYLGYEKDANGLDNNLRIWQNAEKSVFGGQNAWIMSPEDAIANAIGHVAVLHKVENIIFYCDLGFLIDKNSIKWLEVINAIRYSIASSCAYKVLFRAKNDFSINVPSWVLGELESISTDKLSFRRVLANNSNLFYLNYLNKIGETKGFKNKAKILFHFLFPSVEYMKKAYGSNRFIIFWYLIRPIRIFVKYSIMVIKYIFESISSRDSNPSEHTNIPDNK